MYTYEVSCDPTNISSSARPCNQSSLISPDKACAHAWLQVTLDILVEALGRVNFGCVWDFKGLTSPDIKLNGQCRGSLCSTEIHGHAHTGLQQHKLYQNALHWPNAASEARLRPMSVQARSSRAGACIPCSWMI